MRAVGLLAMVLLTATAAVACAEKEFGASSPEQEPTRAASTAPSATTSRESQPAEPESSTPETAEPTYLPAGDLPRPVRLREVGARTVEAQPFADFAVTAGSGVWVTGVDPGAVRYDGESGAVTARAALPGDVGQALAATPTEVFVPIAYPAVLLRIVGATGEVLGRTRLPASPVAEATVGVDGGTSYVLVNPTKPRVVAVEADRVVEQLAAPEGATAVRAGYGSLWVPTTGNTVERYSLEAQRWTSIPVGPGPRFLDVGFGAVWVMNQGDGSVSRVDARTGHVETLPVTGRPIGGGDLTVGAGAVWLRTDSQVARIDPRSRAVTHLIDVPPGSASAAATDGLLVITNHDHDVVHLVPLPLPR